MRKLLKTGIWLCVMGVALTPLAAPLLAPNHPLLALLIRSFFARICHQDPARSFVLQGSPVAVCVRCFGIYCGVALGALCAGQRNAERWLSFALLLNVLDVVTGMFHWHGNLPLPRFLFGLMLGVTAGAILFRPEQTLARFRRFF